VSGVIVQEQLFTNLAYQYNISHLPVYAAAKASINTKKENLDVIIDAGIGPNFVSARQFEDRSLDGGFTLPNHAFTGKTRVAFSAMGGVGLRINQAFGQYPVELGYRFFYLGDSKLTPRTNQILNNLKTGTNTAQALVITVTV